MAKVTIQLPKEILVASEKNGVRIDRIADGRFQITQIISREKQVNKTSYYISLDYLGNCRYQVVSFDLTEGTLEETTENIEPLVVAMLQRVGQI